MKTLILSHPACLDHDNGGGHPECADRLRVILDALHAAPFRDRLEFQKPTPVDDEHVLRAHDKEYLSLIRASSPATGYAALDGDTAMSAGTLNAARCAAGALVMAVDRVLDGTTTRVFCAVRPPGHHATRRRAMGFCIFNNVAIGALYALHKKFARVAIVDIDVHHGNGTQDIVGGRDDTLFLSTQQVPLWPMNMDEQNAPLHNVLNLGFAPYTLPQEVRRAYEAEIFPTLKKFQPDLLFISAGFDAHKNDPLAQQLWDSTDYEHITRGLVTAAGGAPVISTLEGGYDLSALHDSVLAHVRALCS